MFIYVYGKQTRPTPKCFVPLSWKTGVACIARDTRERSKLLYRPGQESGSFLMEVHSFLMEVHNLVKPNVEKKMH